MRPISAFILFLCLPLVSYAEPGIKELKIERIDRGEALSIRATAPLTPQKIFSLDNPYRVVVDMAPAKGGNLKLPRTYKGSLIRGVRFGQFDAGTSRLVVDLSRPATVESNAAGTTLTLTLRDGSAGAASAIVIPAQAGIPSPPLKGDSRVRGNDKIESTVSVAAPNNGKSKPVTEGPTSVAERPAKPKPLVVIDAGHGGQDPGASGIHSSKEKIITLNYARALKDVLLATGKFRVQLTREDDTYILLPERVNIARRAKADLFVSIHADSNPNREARGLSVYTLSDTASDAEAAALAERENKSDIISGIDLNTTDPDVANILIDLTQRETMNKSFTLAESIVKSLQGKIKTLAGTHRYAGFRVLKSPDVPSTLIELGFLTNPEDERQLLTRDYRDMLVAAIAKGIEHYAAGE